MSLDKISITLYDLLGYLLPGYVLLLAVAVAEATLMKTSVFSLSAFTTSALPCAIAAYFLGQFCHAFGSFFKVWSVAHAKRLEAAFVAPNPPKPWKEKMMRFWIRQVHPRVTGLSRPLFDQVFAELGAAYDLQPAQMEENKNLNVYMLCDSWVLASGGSNEREVLQAREGFFKASTVAFLLLGLVLLLSMLWGGAKINQTPTMIKAVSAVASFIFGLLNLWAASICWKRHYFFGCVKKTTVMLLFLALRNVKKQMPPTIP